MEALYQTISLGMVGCGLNVVDAQELAKGWSQLRSELWPPITGDGGRNAESLYPTL
jgi:hypothetical protein